MIDLFLGLFTWSVQYMKIQGAIDLGSCAFLPYILYFTTKFIGTWIMESSNLVWFMLDSRAMYVKML